MDTVSMTRQCVPAGSVDQEATSAAGPSGTVKNSLSIYFAFYHIRQIRDVLVLVVFI